MGSNKIEEIPVSKKKTIAVSVLIVAGALVGFRMIAPTLTDALGPHIAPTPVTAPAAPETQPPAEAPAEAPAESVTAEAGQALTALEQLAIAQPIQTPYDRRQFGQRWADIDRNGCDQRNDVLKRDLVDVTTKPGTRDCVILTGVLLDPYTGLTIDFTRGEATSTDVQIDHVVPLAWAWRQGAADWTEDKREQLANDPLNLLAVDGPTNASKSDQGPALWMPPLESYHCLYAERFVQVLDTYDLTVSPEDHAALQIELSSCTGGE
jgi:hypothetical protein